MSDDDSIPLTREFTVDGSFVTRMMWAVLKRSLLRRPTWWLLLVVAAGAAVLAVLGVEVMWFLAGFLLLGAVLLPVVTFLSVRRQYLRTFPPGTVLRTGFGPTRFASEAPEFLTEIEYSAYARAIREGEFAVLQRRNSKGWNYFPGSLFGDEDLARFPQK